MDTIIKIPSRPKVSKIRAVKQLIEQMPVRKWLLLRSASSYAEMGIDAFANFALENKLTFSEGKRNKRYLVAEIDAVFAKLSTQPQ